MSTTKKIANIPVELRVENEFNYNTDEWTTKVFVHVSIEDVARELSGLDIRSKTFVFGKTIFKFPVDDIPSEFPRA